VALAEVVSSMSLVNGCAARVDDRRRRSCRKWLEMAGGSRRYCVVGCIDFVEKEVLVKCVGQGWDQVVDHVRRTIVFLQGILPLDEAYHLVQHPCSSYLGTPRAQGRTPGPAMRQA